MKIERIKLRNFRQFYGDQEIELATDPIKNVTLIHAENGIGKTTILSAQSDKARRLIKRRSLLTETSQLLKATLSTYEQEARGVIQKQTNSILEKVARRDYRCRFNENFSLELLYSDGRPTPKSGGENQLLSLSFVASLVKFSEIRSRASGSILRPGTIAPLLLDSPFGQLDVTYKEETARFIPRMASQVLLLVSSSQGSEDVLSALEPHVGAEYILVSENRAPRGEKPEDRKTIRNKLYIGSLFGCPKDLTRIERVA
jgi:DNA repair exonuclease SbcCD ATPase subunit